MRRQCACMGKGFVCVCLLAAFVALLSDITFADVAVLSNDAMRQLVGTDCGCTSTTGYGNCEGSGDPEAICPSGCGGSGGVWIVAGNQAHECQYGQSTMTCAKGGDVTCKTHYTCQRGENKSFFKCTIGETGASCEASIWIGEACQTNTPVKTSEEKLPDYYCAQS